MFAPLRRHWRRILAATVAATTAELAAVTLMGTAAWLIVRAAQRPQLEAIAVAIVTVRALALGRGLLRYLDRLVGHDAVLTAVAGARTDVYRALVPLAPAGSPMFRSGDLLTRMVDDVDAVQDLLLRCLTPAAVALTVGAAATTFTATLAPAAGALLAAGLVTAGVLVPAAELAYARRYGTEERTRRAELSVRAVDVTSGVADLTAFGATGRMVGAATAVGSRLAALANRRATATGARTGLLVAVQGLTTAGVAWAALRAQASGDLDPVLVAVLAATALATFDVVTPLAAAARTSVDACASLRRVSSVLRADPPVREPTHPVRPPSAPVVLHVDGLRVRHGREGAAALDGVRLHVRAGERVVVTGASGAGKSTLLAVLMRFVEYEAGSVTFCGRELRDWHGDDVRRLVTGVTEHAHVFHASLRENVLIGRPEATDEALTAVATRARLLHWVESLPDGWDTVVGGDGATMSGGQRQRLLLARALLADPPVLVLDEPTEGLDPDAAEDLLADLLRATEGRTALLVTHLPVAPDTVDQVVELTHGRVAC